MPPRGQMPLPYAPRDVDSPLGRTAADRSWEVMLANQDVPFVRRLMNPNYFGTLPRSVGGSLRDATVRLATSSYPSGVDPEAVAGGYADQEWVYPTIVEEGSGLVERDPSDRRWDREQIARGNAIGFDDPALAREFARGDWKLNLDNKRIPGKINRSRETAPMPTVAGVRYPYSREGIAAAARAQRALQAAAQAQAAFARLPIEQQMERARMPEHLSRRTIIDTSRQEPRGLPVPIDDFIELLREEPVPVERFERAQPATVAPTHIRRFDLDPRAASGGTISPYDLVGTYQNGNLGGTFQPYAR